jgi:class 3 adenylate cyclase/tetratricopeptide (TPR) repeat protein
MTDDPSAERDLLRRISTRRRDLAVLLSIWRQRGELASGWVATPGVYAQLARAFIEVGAPLLGLEVAAEGLEAFADDTGLRQARGLALARSGSTEEANRALEQLRQEGHLEVETLGILARTHKDLGIDAAGAARHAHLEAARRLYAEAYAVSGSYWSGINVATLAVLLGEREQSLAIARRVLAACQGELARAPADHPDRYWLLATLGEAALAQNDWTQAEDWYRQAWEMGRQRYGDLNSTRRNARLLAEQLGRDPGVVDAWMPLPRVVLFSGHMIDLPGRDPPRFPHAAEQAVADAIRSWLLANNGLIGVSSAARGADLLFLEAIHDLGGEAHIVLPYEIDEFVEDSVALAGPGDWLARFERRINSSRVVYASSSRPLIDGLAHDYANRIVQGLGQLRARELDTDLLALAVWDGQPGDGHGGTESAVRLWQRHDIAVHRVAIEALVAGAAAAVASMPVEPVAPLPPAADGAAPADDAVMSLLFGDAVGFSRLTDAEVPLFVEHCLGLVARLIAAAPDAVAVRETWGDGLFLAFTNQRAAGIFALDLLDAIAATDWLALGFARPLTMRLALHAGPVHLTTDPITGLPKCCGTHVSRAARLEPRTPPGQVYASEAFAALAGMEDIAEFRCDYVKQLDWAKRYGTFPAYLVRRRRSP